MTRPFSMMTPMPEPDMVFVLSTAIEAIGYDGARGELWIRFRETGTYVYPGVPRGVFDAFLEADSKGVFFNEAVRSRYDGSPA
jgi:lysyl-tRNA synthetase class 2